MPPIVAMHDLSFDHISKRLEALELDIQIVPFDGDGMFRFPDGAVPAAEAAVDYLWLSQHVTAVNQGDAIFNVVLGCKSVGILQTFNAGLDHPFYAKLAAKGTRILNSSAQGVAIAEYAIGQTLAVLQPIETQRRQQAETAWRVTPFREISKTHWLVVGFGPIGSAIAKRVKAFGAEVSVIRRSKRAHDDADRVGDLADAAAFAGDADVIVLACPLNDETRGFADAAFFGSAKPGAILVNVARGGLVDDTALIQALDDDQIETAILDVFHQEPLPDDNPFWRHPKVRLTPHTSFAGNGVQDRWDTLFLDNIQRFVAGQKLLREVDPADLL